MSKISCIECGKSVQKDDAHCSGNRLENKNLSGDHVCNECHKAFYGDDNGNKVTKVKCCECELSVDSGEAFYMGDETDNIDESNEWLCDNCDLMLYGDGYIE